MLLAELCSHRELLNLQRFLHDLLLRLLHIALVDCSLQEAGIGSGKAVASLGSRGHAALRGERAHVDTVLLVHEGLLLFIQQLNGLRAGEPDREVEAGRAVVKPEHARPGRLRALLEEGVLETVINNRKHERGYAERGLLGYEFLKKAGDKVARLKAAGNVQRGQVRSELKQHGPFRELRVRDWVFFQEQLVLQLYLEVGWL